MALGAFGAHGLRDRLGAADAGDLPHRRALPPGPRRWRRWRWRWPPIACAAPRLIAGLFAAGVAIFSGSLYLLAITGVLWLGAVTPVGGLLLLAGWAAVLVEGFRRAA